MMHERAFRAKTSRACNVREACGATAAWQDELLQRGQIGVETFDRIFEADDVGVADGAIAGNGKLAAEVEQVVLNGDQARRDVRRERFREKHAEHGIELIDGAKRLDARR